MGGLQPILLRTGYMMVLSVTWCSMMFMDFPCLHVVLQNWDVDSRSDQRWPTSVRTVRSRVATIATSRRSCRMAMKWISYTSGWRSQMAMRAVWRMWRRRFVTAGWFKLPAFFCQLYEYKACFLCFGSVKLQHSPTGASSTSPVHLFYSFWSNYG